MPRGPPVQPEGAQSSAKIVKSSLKDFFFKFIKKSSLGVSSVALGRPQKPNKLPNLNFFYLKSSNLSCMRISVYYQYDLKKNVKKCSPSPMWPKGAQSTAEHCCTWKDCWDLLSLFETCWEVLSSAQQHPATKLSKTLSSSQQLSQKCSAAFKNTQQCLHAISSYKKRCEF